MVVLWFGLLMFFVRQKTQYVVVLCLGLSLVSKHNAWSYRYYGWVCRCYRSSVNTVSGGIMVGFVVVVVVQ